MWKCSVVIRKDTEEEEKAGVEAGVWGGRDGCSSGYGNGASISGRADCVV